MSTEIPLIMHSDYHFEKIKDCLDLVWMNHTGEGKVQ